ncbi:hypothetical protein A1O1_05298 [Capronia coronata CBS 617.96]|uniref:Uncharacterized protein n=1 Tax=Capronia coronata CBS 617.96 TaxID=1182541 RepID=W9Y789_9EURO|nr:uncharacterized protein A1O1_05298 [Capronia coronata CBS 617.96]EXJ88368.1 hypothetical protein A1O1_05298 [Capronia coronata CBS 617.96]
MASNRNTIPPPVPEVPQATGRNMELPTDLDAITAILSAQVREVARLRQRVVMVGHFDRRRRMMDMLDDEETWGSGSASASTSSESESESDSDSESNSDDETASHASRRPGSDDSWRYLCLFTILDLHTIANANANANEPVNMASEERHSRTRNTNNDAEQATTTTTTTTRAREYLLSLELCSDMEPTRHRIVLPDAHFTLILQWFMDGVRPVVNIRNFWERRGHTHALWLVGHDYFSPRCWGPCREECGGPDSTAEALEDLLDEEGIVVERLSL